MSLNAPSEEALAGRWVDKDKSQKNNVLSVDFMYRDTTQVAYGCCMHDDFSEQQLQEIKQSLLARYHSLQSQLAETGESEVVELDQSRMGRLSRIDAIQRQQMAKKQRNRMKLELQEAATALRQLENCPQDFGYCEECDDLLPIQRILSRPETRYCVSCLRLRGG